MKHRWLWIVIAANLVVLVALAFIYPHLMVSPGALSAGHAELATDCFACHAPLRGVASDHCISCHAVADIGLRTSKGVPIDKAAASSSGSTASHPIVKAESSPNPSARGANSAKGKATAAVKTSFHQELIEQDCVTCHSDHAGPKLTQRSRKPFSHDLLKVATRERCESCHAAPTDTLHRQITGNCGQCHTSKAWTPATFDHDKFFVLDRDHNAACATCHVANNYARYTCYGCHEHTAANIRAEHEEEGIVNFGNCVRCHRSAQDKGEGGGRG